MTNQAANPQQVHADDQSSGHLPCTPIIISGSPARRTPEACERELIQYKAMEIRLCDALAESEARLRQKDELIQKQELLKKEFDHRLLNDLQMTISLLSLQSRGSTNPEVASQLAVAANRVAMIARIHHRLNSSEGVQTIEFKKFLADFGHDFSAMVSSHERPAQVVVEGIEIRLPVATAIPLGFIASELITNAANYGEDRIAIRLQPHPENGYSLSVSNDGPPLPEGFGPGASEGMGLRIIQSFASQSAVNCGSAEARMARARDLRCCFLHRRKQEPRLSHHAEKHLVDRIGWLRAAVLGASDGIISTANLIVGVAAAVKSASGSQKRTWRALEMRRPLLPRDLAPVLRRPVEPAPNELTSSV